MVRCAIVLLCLLPTFASAELDEVERSWLGQIDSSKPQINGPLPPYPTKEPLIWTADVCLRYFLTRHPLEWGDAEISRNDSTGLYMWLPERAQVRAYQRGGNFVCETTAWPHISVTAATKAELLRWAAQTLTTDEGWQGQIIFNAIGTWSEITNPSRKATFFVYGAGDNYHVGVRGRGKRTPLIIE